MSILRAHAHLNAHAPAFRTHSLRYSELRDEILEKSRNRRFKEYKNLKIGSHIETNTFDKLGDISKLKGIISIEHAQNQIQKDSL